MSDALSDFEREALRRSFAWNEWDCGLICAAWVERMRGVNPAAIWRDRYTTALDCARMVAREGGLVAMFDRSLAPFGIGRTDEPRRGDIAVVATGQGETGAIMLGEHLVMMTAAHGILLRHRSIAPVLAAWRV